MHQPQFESNPPSAVHPPCSAMAAVVELLPTQNKIVDNSIFCWLTPQQVCMVSQANQALRLAGSDADLWRSLYDAHWTPGLSSATDWTQRDTSGCAP